MNKELPMPEIARRERNFFNGIEPSTSEERTRYAQLENLAMDIEGGIHKLQEITPVHILKNLIFSRVYNFVISQNNDYSLFDNNMAIYDDAFDVCYFMSVCMFLYETRRIKGISLSEFIRKYSPTGFSQKGGPNYFDRKRYQKKSEIGDVLTQEETRLRQSRYRFLKDRPVFHKSQEWSAMRAVSEHEWTLYFFMNQEDDPKPSKDDDDETKRELECQAKERAKIRETYKRIKNLYADVNKAINSEMDEGYIQRLDTAAEKFCSKLDKLQYEHFLKLGKFCLDHVSKDKTWYGINLYRFEKELQLYRTTIDVNQLLNCNDEAEADRIVDLAMRMVNIIFPKLYEYFSNLPDVKQTQFYADTFWSFMDETVRSSRLIIDKFVEDGVFGDDWEQLFRQVTNELAETVLYDPSKINYSLTPDSQREFQIYLLEPVNYLIMRKKYQYQLPHSISPFEVGDDDE